MRFIPTKFHAPLDYIVGAVLIAGPWILQYSDDNAATVISIVLGVGLIAYSLLTNYELGVWKVAPMAVHNLIDIVAGALLAAYEEAALALVDQVPAARQAESWLFRSTEAGRVLIAARDALRGAEYPRGVWFAIVPAGQPGP